MTALCGGGASRARPGIVGTAFNTAANVTSYLSTFTPLPFAIAVGALAAVETFDVATYCSIDPPADPGLTATDIADFLNPGQLETWLPAQVKVRQWWRHVYWWQVCECASVATPPLPPPSNPGGSSSGSGLPSGGSTNCYTSSAGFNDTGVQSGSAFRDLTSIWMPETTDTISVPLTGINASGTAQARRIPPNVTTWNFTTQNHGATTGGGNNAYDGAVAFFNASGTQTGGHQFLTSQATQIGPLTGSTALPANSLYAAIYSDQTLDFAIQGKQLTWEVDFRFGCGGDGIQSPCCPPDPGLELKINQMFELLVDLSSRSGSSAATSWRDGTRHTALSGNGRLVFAAGTVGVRVEITTLPPGLDQHPGNPTFYFDAGFITPIAIDVPLRGQRLVFNPQSFAMPQFADGISWTLPAGMVVNLIELLPA